MSKLEFPIDKIMSVTDARNNFNKIVEEVEKDPEGKYLLTKGGNPSVVIINADHLEKLIGEKPTTTQTAKKVEEKSIPKPTPETSPMQQTAKIIEDKEIPEQTPETPPTAANQPTQNPQTPPPSGQTPANRPEEHTNPYAQSTQPGDPPKENT
jgi:prevent-host-death family protein